MNWQPGIAERGEKKVIRVTENFLKIKKLLENSATDAGRDEGSVRLLAVSKQKPLEAILEAASAGQRDFGENFVRDGVEKIRSADRDDLHWHFIGHIQSNKPRLIAEYFEWVHTIDREKIARRLSEQRPQHAPDLNVCIEVNIDAEPQKSGVLPSETADLARNISALPRLKLRGLMCLPKIRDGFEEQRKPFAALRELQASLNSQGFSLDTLSMGMTADYAAAIHEGATIVRIGTALFGERE